MKKPDERGDLLKGLLLAKRAVLTSAFGAIGEGHKQHVGPYTEEDWS
ncbi:hypothetical protein NSS64_29475 [Paenibacillus sp. FSL H8-0122]